jgi:hypothetical protein
MAKQTFTTGQVLTAAQMTSLQQTAMGGGSTTAKTTSYVLVAADAGTVVQMNSASATTITVNTALFAAGDTVQIQNVGSGVCTVTAGTATVSTSAVLALKQYDAGSLYFNTTSAAIFFAVDAADGMTNPFTTTGDTVYASGGTTPTRLGIGSTGQVLTVASGIPSWATPASSSPTYVGAFAYSNASQSIANATNTAILLQAENFDTDGFHSTSSNTSRMTIPTGKSGKYLIQGALLWQNGTTGARTLGFFKNATQIALWDITPLSSTTWSFTCSMTMDLVATDYVELYAVQQSGGAVNVYGTNVGNGTSTFLSISLLGA